ncbi:IS5/IS1182 family transposase, partial [Neisseria meningitidis]|nr:IS5/IS1182 family transposase [Neisseria meningitidis]
KGNRDLSKTRHVVEQRYGTLHRKVRYAGAADFGVNKERTESHLEAR